MHVTLVQVHAKQKHIADLNTAWRADHQDSVPHQACRGAAARYSRRRERVAPWMAEPRLGVKYIDLFPETR